MNRRERLHKNWLKENIAARLRCKSYLTLGGKRELEELQKELAVLDRNSYNVNNFFGK